VEFRTVRSFEFSRLKAEGPRCQVEDETGNQ